MSDDGQPGARKEPESLDTLVGPFYDAAEVAVLLGVTAKEVQGLRDAGGLFTVETSDAVKAYPVFQFANGRVVPALVPVFQALWGTPRWAAALWCLTANPDLGGVTPLVWVKEHRLTDEVVASAARTAREWR